MARHASIVRKFVWTFLVTATAAGCGGGGGGSTPPTGPSPVPGGPAATITITDAGVSAATVDISAGQQVEFINASSRDRTVYSTPHGLHTDCPAINQVDVLAPGQRRMTGPLNNVRLCGFHDHMDPTNNAFRGTIRVGTVSGPAPEY